LSSSRKELGLDAKAVQFRTAEPKTSRAPFPPATERPDGLVVLIERAFDSHASSWPSFSQAEEENGCQFMHSLRGSTRAVYSLPVPTIGRMVVMATNYAAENPQGKPKRAELPVESDLDSTERPYI